MALTYNDKDHGFRVQYRLGWTVGQGDSEFNTVVRFISTQNDANVDIRIFPKGDYKSIEGLHSKSPTMDTNCLSIIEIVRLR